MKYTQIFSLIFCVFTISIGTSQNYHCGTDQSDTFMKNLRVNKKLFENTRNKSRVDRFIPITFHSVASTQGEGRINDLSIYEALCTMNERYEETEMRFYLQNINYIDNTNIYDSPGGAQGRIAINNAKSSNSLNVFIVDFAGTGVAGYYTGGLDVVVILKNALGDDRYTLEHELGHFFTLAHTHRGWDQIASGPNVTQGGYDPAIHGDTITMTTISSSQSGSTLIELSDGSNCTIAADEICDTPPDYGFGFSCSCCTMIFPNVRDFNGDEIFPMMDNVMSYSNNCNPFKFTEEQTTAMLTDFDSNRRNYLRGGSVSTYEPVTETATLLTPTFGSKVENYNGVFFDWEDVPNADSYLVQIDGDVELEYITTSSELFIEDLEPDAVYFWQVASLGKFGTSCQLEDVILFETGSGTTSTNEVEGISNVGIHPNPVSNGLDINVFITADEVMSSVVSLIDINGRVVLTQNEGIQRGENHIKLKTSTITCGLYVVEVQTANGRMTDKIFIK